MARTGSPTCSVAMLEQYFRLGGLSHSSTLSLFRGITRTKQGERLRASGSLSYTLWWILVSSDYIVCVRANAGVADRLFKRHGRWRSEAAKDGYIKDSERALVSVSKSLNL